MKKTYRGYWYSASTNEYTTHEVKAPNKDVAWRLLAKWAWCHRNMVDDALAFEVDVVWTDDQLHVINVLKKIALTVSMLFGTVGFFLLSFNDTLPMSQIVPQICLAVTLICVAVGIYNKIGGEYNA